MQVAAIGKRSGSEPCPRCRTTRKVKLAGVGWVCCKCLEACRRVVEKSKDLELIGDPDLRLQVTGELALELYRKVARRWTLCVSCGGITGPDAEDFGDGMMCGTCTTKLVADLEGLMNGESRRESTGFRRTIAR